jgi:hypothetical protein
MSLAKDLELDARAYPDRYRMTRSHNVLLRCQPRIIQSVRGGTVRVPSVLWRFKRLWRIHLLNRPGGTGKTDVRRGRLGEC